MTDAALSSSHPRHPPQLSIMTHYAVIGSQVAALTCRVPVESSRTGGEPPPLPDADPALGGGVSRWRPSRGGGEDRDERRGQERRLLPQCRGEEGGPAGMKNSDITTNIRTDASGGSAFVVVGLTG